MERHVIFIIFFTFAPAMIASVIVVVVGLLTIDKS